jgi:hypothetical protein
LALLPPDFIDDARWAADETLKKEATKDPEGAKKKLIVGFSAQKVTVQMLEDYLGHPLDQASPAQVASLRSTWVSIRDGNSTWAELVVKEAPRKGGPVDLQETLEGEIIDPDWKPGAEEQAEIDAKG